jgi:hypothetical protein
MDRKTDAIDRHIGVKHRPGDTEAQKLRNVLAAMERKHNRKMPGFMHRLTEYPAKVEKNAEKREKNVKEMGMDKHVIHLNSLVCAGVLEAGTWAWCWWQGKKDEVSDGHSEFSSPL